MNEMPPDDDAPDEVDDLYRRAAALDPSRPSDSARRSIMDHAARVAAGRAAQNIPTDIGTARSAPKRRWRPAFVGTLAAALLAGLVVIPRFWTAPAPRQSERYPPAAPATAYESAAPSNSAAPVAPPKVEELQSAGRVAENAAKPRSAAAQGAPAPSARDSALDESSGALASLTATAAKKAAPSPQSPQSPADFAQSSRPALAGAFPARQRVDSSAALRRAAQVGDIPALNQMLGQPVDVDGRDDMGRTALMLAIRNGQGGAVDALLAHGADPNAADSKGTSPLEAALERADPSIISALRRGGARENQ